MEVSEKRWSIWFDHRITRRKFYHVVLNPQGHVVFNSRLLGECVDYLIANDITEFDMAGPETRSMICVLSPHSERATN